MCVVVQMEPLSNAHVVPGPALFLTPIHTAAAVGFRGFKTKLLATVRNRPAFDARATFEPMGARG